MQCERFYIKPYNPFVHVPVHVPVPETASVNTAIVRQLAKLDYVNLYDHPEIKLNRSLKMQKLPLDFNFSKWVFQMMNCEDLKRRQYITIMNQLWIQN